METPQGFPSTCWSRFSMIGQDSASPEDRQLALEQLANNYWRPAYWYVRLSLRQSVEDSQDLTQAFFVHAMESDLLAKADRERGRFRSFLKVGLRNFVTDQARAKKTQRRGGNRIHIRWAGAGEELASSTAADGATPEEIFEQEWRKSVVSQATEAIEAKFAAEGRGVYFEVFRMYDLSEGEEVRYADVAERHSISVNDVQNYLRRARQAFREQIKREVWHTVTSEEHFEAELAELFG